MHSKASKTSYVARIHPSNIEMCEVLFMLYRGGKHEVHVLTKVKRNKEIVLHCNIRTQSFKPQTEAKGQMSWQEVCNK